MVYAYVRVSTDKQSTETQRFEIKKFSKTKKIHIDRWIDETISGMKGIQNRRLGKVLRQARKGDVGSACCAAYVCSSHSPVHGHHAQRVVLGDAREGDEVGGGEAHKAFLPFRCGFADARAGGLEIELRNLRPCKRGVGVARRYHEVVAFECHNGLLRKRVNGGAAVGELHHEFALRLCRRGGKQAKQDKDKDVFH